MGRRASIPMSFVSVRCGWSLRCARSTPRSGRRSRRWRALGIGTAETLRNWIRRAEVDAGAAAGGDVAEAEEKRALRKEIAELRRANVILGWVDCLGA